MAISEPFEIRISKFDEEDVDLGAKGLYEQAVEAALLPVVQNCLDRDPDIAPNQPEEPFGGHVERDTKYAKRIVYAIREMFGIEFAPPVVAADGSVRKLAWRICNAKEVLVCTTSTTRLLKANSSLGSIQHVIIKRNYDACNPGLPVRKGLVEKRKCLEILSDRCFRGDSMG
jgi:phosphatidylethanolamine N-methyltransferase